MLVTADALELPFADGGFEVVCTEHAAMNIEDKPRLYSELRRVLRPGGRLPSRYSPSRTRPRQR